MRDIETWSWVLPDGTLVGLGNHEPPDDVVVRVSGQLPDIPKSEWREFDLRTDSTYKVKVKDQGQYGACNGHAAATSLEIARYIAGMEHVDLSAWLVYADLCNGRDVGSNISQALLHLESKGTCEDTLVKHGTINPRNIQQAARDNAKRYKIEIGYRINNFNDMCVAAQLRMPFNYSVPVNGNFNTLDRNGVPGNRSGWHNHAVTGGLYMKKLSDGTWIVGSQNSWTERWGNRGYFSAAERTVEGRGFDAYSVTAVTVDPQNLPPKVK
jgi:hypothetical protein